MSFTNEEKLEELCQRVKALETKLQNAMVPVYRLTNAAFGHTWDLWNPGSGGQDFEEQGWLNAWSGPPVAGIPTHVQGAPTSSGTDSDSHYQDVGSNQDESRVCYWIHNTSDVPVEYLDNDKRFESYRIYAGCDGTASLLWEKYEENTPTSVPDTQGNAFLTLPPGGLTKITVLIHDPGENFSGFNLVARNAITGDEMNAVSYQDRPVKECLLVPVCGPIPGGYQLKPIDCFCVNP
jgi:hypothetical protein